MVSPDLLMFFFRVFVGIEEVSNDFMVTMWLGYVQTVLARGGIVLTKDDGHGDRSSYGCCIYGYVG